MSIKEKIKAHKHVLINILVAGVFFAGGYFTHLWTAGTGRPSGFPGNGTFTGSNGEMPSMNRTSGDSTTGSGTTTGTIVSNSGSYITVKLSSGSTKNVYINDSTTLYARSTTTADQLTADKKVVVQGTTNSDNSITGTTVTVE